MELELFDDLDEVKKFINDKFTIDELFKRSLQFKNLDDFKKFFKFIASFNHYSRYNTMLVYIQNPAVTFFGGTTFWKNRSRTINKDAKPLLILYPHGPIMLVYDIIDTSGKQSAEEYLKAGLGREVFKANGKIPIDRYDKTIETVKSWGINIIYKPLSYFNGGYITTVFTGFLDIALKKDTEIEKNFRVLIHELAHLFLGHTGHKSIKLSKKEQTIKFNCRTLDRTTQELEAETVSFLVCSRVGLITNASDYLAGYITSNKNLEEFNYELVIKTADKIESLFIK